MDSIPKISIVLITRNSRSVLFDCLKSLDEKDEITSSKNAQWIIVDNAGSDGSIEEIEKIYPNIKVIRNTDNLGFAKAANIGYKESSNEYILYINTDTEIEYGAVSKLYNAVKSDKNIAVVGPRLIRKNGTIQKSVYPEATLYTELFKPFVKLYVSFKEKFYSTKKCYSVNSLRGACFIINKNYMHDVSLFDERYFFYLEETDLFRRLKMSGKKICYLPDSRVYHYGGLGCDDKMSFDKKKIYNESLIKYFRKNRNRFENFIINILIRS